MIKPLNLLLFTLVICAINTRSLAQTTTENSGWLFVSASQKLSSKWSVSADVQARSANHFNYFAVLLLRPGLVYNFTEKQASTLGYTYFGTWEKEEGETTFTPEHRIWEQYEVAGSIAQAELTNRFRLEQRFIQNGNDAFTQRLRYALKAKIPLATDAAFTKGFFAAVQNELFLNVYKRNNSNGKTFDQNRLNTALGFRFSKQFDLEAGYLYRYQIEETGHLVSHVFQLALYADL